MESKVSFGIGALAFGAIQVAWSLGHAYAGWRGAWVMKAELGMAVCFAVFLILGAIVVAHRHRATELPRRAGSLWLGAMASLVVALMIVGPGNLWPLVIVLDGAMIGGGVALGAVIGAVVGGRHAA
jgi:hypothetical protein